MSFEDEEYGSGEVMGFGSINNSDEVIGINSERKDCLIAARIVLVTAMKRQ